MCNGLDEDMVLRNGVWWMSVCEKARERDRETTAVPCNSPFAALQQTGSEALNYPSALYLSPCLCLCPVSPCFFRSFLHRAPLRSHPVFPSWSFSFYLCACVSFHCQLANPFGHKHTQTHTLVGNVAAFSSLALGFSPGSEQVLWFQTLCTWNIIILCCSLPV